MAAVVLASMLLGGGGKGAKKWGGKKVHKKFSDLPEDKKEAILSKHAEKAKEEGRKPMGGATYQGTIVKSMASYGWIKPTNIMKLPKPVKDKMKEMTKEKKSSAAEHNHDDTFDEDILYFRKSDVEGFPAIRLKSDMEVKFKVYVDEKGAGAFAVVPPAEANID